MNLKWIDLQVCDKCGRGFVTSSVLKEHAKLHSGTKKSFGCTTCGAKYASFADLKIHQRRYTYIQTKMLFKWIFFWSYFHLFFLDILVNCPFAVSNATKVSGQRDCYKNMDGVCIFIQNVVQFHGIFFIWQ